MIVSNNYFKFKYKMLDFERLPNVKPILLELANIDNDNLQSYVDDNNIYKKLVDAYWLSIYDNKETIDLVEEILYEKLFLNFNKNNSEKVAEEIRETCIKKGRPDLKEKILNVCPNGDQVVKVLLNSIFSSRGLRWKQM